MSFALVLANRPTTRPSFPTGREEGLDLDSFARQAGVHPEVVRRLVRLGLLEPVGSRTDEGLYFAPSQFAELGRIERLRAGLCINYAGIGVVIDLLDRIAELDAVVRRAGWRPPDRRTSTPLPSSSRERTTAPDWHAATSPGHATGPGGHLPQPGAYTVRRIGGGSWM
ncbi:chaperone modulator CbpM [Actinopolymorpha pittospori]|uniref:DNA-binding transcriptional MerR regulator n=1 Tax=Actinopolymorpha pittospori TaxID=648752 RepID=A0A927R9S6_9ACTN|nr:DNA-binding transcriptional MerR regulator [Actinopolymorpha pittospori]